MNFRTKNGAGGTTSLILQVTPIVDILLVLVVFLLVAYAQQASEARIPVTLPQASNASSQADAGAIVINVLKDGTIVLNERQLEPEDLKNLMAKLVQATPGVSVIVRGDKDASYQSILKVVDLCGGASVQTVGFASLDPEPATP